MDLTLYAFGNGEILIKTFNAIAMVLNGDGGLLNTLIRLGAMTGALLALVAAFQQQSIQPFLQHWFVPSYAIMTALLVPQVTVHVVDKVALISERSDRQAFGSVAHVPIGLALVSCTFSQMSYLVTQKVESAFALPDDIGYHKTGSLFTGKLVESLRATRIHGSSLLENMNQFVNQCVLFTALMGQKYTLEDLRTSPDLYGLINQYVPKTRSMLYVEGPGKASSIKTCQDAWTLLKKDLAEESETALEWMGNRLFGPSEIQTKSLTPSAGPRLKAILTTGLGQLFSMKNQGIETVRQILLMNALVDGVEERSVALGNAPKFASRRAWLQQRVTFETLGDMAGSFLPLLKGVLEAIVYALFILIIPLSVMTFKGSVFFQWMRLVAWLNIWPPLFGIIHGVTCFWSQKYLSGHSLTLNTASYLFNVYGDAHAISGYLCMGVPLLAWSLMERGSFALTNLVSSLLPQGAAASTAQEVVSGNLSYGNLSVGSTNMGLENYHQFRDSIQVDSGGMRFSEGTMDTMVGADGKSTFTVHSSKLPMDVSIADLTSQNLQHQMNTAQSTTIQKAQSAQESYTAGLRNLVDRGSHVAHSSSSQLSHSEGKSHTLDQAAQQVQNLTHRFAEQHGISENDAVRLLGQASGRVGLGSIVGVSGEVSGSTDTTKSHLLSKAEDYVQSADWKRAESFAQTAARQESVNASSEEGRRFAEGVNASFETSKHYRQDAQKSYQNMVSYGEQLAYVQNHSAHINTNTNDRFIDYIQDTMHLSSRYAAAKWIQENPHVAQGAAQSFVQSHGGVTGGFNDSHAQKVKDSYDHHAIQNTTTKDYEGYQDKTKSQSFETPSSVNAALSQRVDQRISQELPKNQNLTKNALEDKVTQKLETNTAVNTAKNAVGNVGSNLVDIKDAGLEQLQNVTDSLKKLGNPSNNRRN